MLTRGGDERGGVGGGLEGERGGGHAQWRGEGGAAQLVQFDEGGLDGELRRGGTALQGQLGRLDHAGFQQRGDAGGRAGEERVLQRGETPGHLAGGLRLGLAGVEPIGEGLGAGGQGVFKARETQLGELELAAGDGFPQGEAAGPLEGLRDRDRPGTAFADQGARDIGDALVPEAEGQFRIGPGCGEPPAGLGGGDFVLVKLKFGIPGGDFSDQGRQ